MKVVSMGVSGGIVEVFVWLAKVFGCLFLGMGNVETISKYKAPMCTCWWN